MPDTPIPNPKPVTDLKDGRVRVRVTTLKEPPSGSSMRSIGGNKDSDSGDDDSDGAAAEKYSVDIPDAQKQKLSATVRRELEKAGLSASGRFKTGSISFRFGRFFDSSYQIASDCRRLTLFRPLFQEERSK